MRRFLAPLVLLVVMVVTPIEGGASQLIGCVVNGFVTTGAGASVADATVCVTTATDAATVKTGPDGGFSVTVGAGDGTVSARKTGFQETRLEIAPRDGQTLRLHLVLRAEAGGRS